MDLAIEFIFYKRIKNMWTKCTAENRYTCFSDPIAEATKDINAILPEQNALISINYHNKLIFRISNDYDNNYSMYIFPGINQVDTIEHIPLKEVKKMIKKELATLAESEAKVS